MLLRSLTLASIVEEAPLVSFIATSKWRLIDLPTLRKIFDNLEAGEQRPTWSAFDKNRSSNGRYSA